jgi:predicted AlkP superfamily pyrophosphatase or phosphodiesterase
LRDRLNQRVVHGKAYLRSELPKHYRYSSPRAGDVVVVMNESWTLATSPPSPRPIARWGMHGWDPALTSMHALFIVSGPGVRAGSTVGEVRNVDVYHFMTEQLGLKPAPNLDGEPRRIGRSVMK